MRPGVLLCATACLGLAAVVALSRDSSQPAKPSPAAALVRQLGDRRFAQREAAAKALEKMAVKGLPDVIEAVATTRDPELRRRALRILPRILPKELVSPSTDMKLLPIPLGLLHMGSPEQEKNRRGDERLHRVWVNRPFYLGKYEVTQEEYKQVMKHNPSWFAETGAGKTKVQGVETKRYPVEQVTWYDAIEFCNRLSKLDKLTPYYKTANVKKSGNSITSATVTIAGGNGYRLPTEAEWEHACRAGSTTAFHYGVVTNQNMANIKPVWVSGGYGGSLKWPDLARTNHVGRYKPNAWGLYDMHGNVAEWCWDWYERDYYAVSPLDDPHGPRKGTHRALRGGSWLVTEASCRSASRLGHTPDEEKYYIGFRVARNP